MMDASNPTSELYQIVIRIVAEALLVLRLADFVVAFAAGQTATTTLSAREQMLAFVDKYGCFKNSLSAKLPKPREGLVVVLTGATGALGAQLLATLLTSSQKTRSRRSTLLYGHETTCKLPIV